MSDLSKYCGYTFDYEIARRDIVDAWHRNGVIIDLKELRPLREPPPPRLRPMFRETSLPMLPPMNPFLE